MTLEEYKKLKPPNVEEYDPPIATNPNPTQEQIDTAKRILEKYEGIRILKSGMEIKYEEYLKSDDKTKIINSKEYYKIVDCYVGELFGIMTVPHGAVSKANIWLVDENGFKFFSKGMMHIRFLEGVPEWYLNLANIGIKVSKPCEIGNYVRLYDEETENIYNYDYTICPNNSQEFFVNTCRKIENYYPDIVKEDLLTDVDGTTIQKYHIGRNEIVVYDDYEVGAVYVHSDINLESVFREV